MLPDQSKELSSHISSDIRRPWRIEPKEISGAFLASLLHHRLDVVQEGQLVSVARFLHCSLVVSDFLVKLLFTTANNRQPLADRLRDTSQDGWWMT